MSYNFVPDYSSALWYNTPQEDNNHLFSTASGNAEFEPVFQQPTFHANYQTYQEDPLLFILPEALAAKQLEDLTSFIANPDFDLSQFLEDTSPIITPSAENQQVFSSPTPVPLRNKQSAQKARRSRPISIRNCSSSPERSRSRSSPSLSQTDSSSDFESFRKRTRRKPAAVPITSPAHPDYRKNRDRNNIAVRKSRQKKKVEVAMTKSERDAFAVEIQKLRDENQRKQFLLDMLEEEIRSQCSHDDLLKQIQNHSDSTSAQPYNISTFITAGLVGDQRMRKRKAPDHSN